MLDSISRSGLFTYLMDCFTVTNPENKLNFISPVMSSYVNRFFLIVERNFILGLMYTPSNSIASVMLKNAQLFHCPDPFAFTNLASLETFCYLKLSRVQFEDLWKSMIFVSASAKLVSGKVRENLR